LDSIEKCTALLAGRMEPTPGGDLPSDFAQVDEHTRRRALRRFRQSEAANRGGPDEARTAIKVRFLERGHQLDCGRQRLRLDQRSHLFSRISLHRG
jgi:hypothetical protein